MSLNNSKKVLLFYADWCGHCVQFKPKWEKLKEYFKEHDIKVEEYEHKSLDKNIMDKYSIKAFPTIKVENENNEIIEYTGEREIEPIINFLKEKQIGGGSSISIYQYVTCPITRESFSISSKKGKQILYQHLKNL